MKTKDPAAVALGSKGGKARARKLSKKRRSEIARNAALAGTKEERHARAVKAARARHEMRRCPRIRATAELT